MKIIERFIEWAVRLEGSNRIYRGLANKSWEVTSSLYRSFDGMADFSCMLEYTKEMLERAEEAAGGIGESNRNLSDLEMLSCLQHYGMPTSLIDFTNNPLIALWFACQDKYVDGKVVSVDASDNNKFIEISGESVEEEISCFSEKDKLYKLVPPIYVSERVATQNSVFLFGAKQIAEDIYVEFPIDKKEKEEVLTILEEKLGIHEKTIFPDLTSLLRFNARLYGFIGRYHYEKGLRTYDRREFDDAIGHFGMVIKLIEDKAPAYHNRARAYTLTEEYKNAIADYIEVIKLEPNNAAALFNRGGVYNLMGRYKEAIADYTKVVNIKPEDAVAFYARGLIYDRMKKYEKSIADYTKVTKLKPNDYAAFNKRGSVYSRTGKHKKAIADYTRVIELMPSDAAAYYHRGEIYKHMGKNEEAIDDYTVVIKLEPKNAAAFYARGLAKKALGDAEGAKKDFAMARKLKKG